MAPVVGGLVLLAAIAGLLLTRCSVAAPLPPQDGPGYTCLALAMFGEARSEGEDGMREVGRVVLRRVLDPQERFGGDICSVAMDGRQFLALAAWQPPRQPQRMNPVEWAIAQRLAQELIAAGPPAADAGPCPGALYFNQTKRPEAVCRIGVHFFYK